MSSESTPSPSLTTGPAHRWTSRRRTVSLSITTAVLSAVALSVMPGQTPTAHAATISTIAGEDRYETAIAASNQLTAGSGGTVFLATGENFADALAAGPAAAIEKAPVLLAQRDSVPQGVVNEIQRIAPSRIVVVGSAVSANAAAQAAAAAPPNARIERVAGGDRIQTAAAINAKWFPNAEKAMVVNGWSYADALSASAAAAAERQPIVISTANELPAVSVNSLKSMRARNIMIVGGDAAVSPGVANEMKSIASVGRVAGYTRFETASKMSTVYFSGKPTTGAFVATGENWPDGIIASPLSGKFQRPLLLTSTECVTSDTRAQMQDRSAKGGPLVRVGNSTPVEAWQVDCEELRKKREAEAAAARAAAEKAAAEAAVKAAAEAAAKAAAEAAAAAARNDRGNQVVYWARQAIGIPYGPGYSPEMGYMDCSGLVKWVYGHVNIDLPWGVKGQARRGYVTNNPQPGDLVVYDGYHVGIYVGPNRMIDAPDYGRTIKERDIWGSPRFVHIP